MKKWIVQLLLVVVLFSLLIFADRYIGGVVLTGNIPDQVLEVNQIKDINLYSYFSGINLSFSALPMKNVDVSIKDGIAILTPDEGFVGEETTIFTAYENETAINSNVVRITVGGVEKVNESIVNESENLSEEGFGIPEIVESVDITGEASNDSEFVGLSGTAPSVSDTQIILPYTIAYSNSSSLNCSASVSDPDVADEKLNVSFRWYRNDVDQAAFYGNVTNIDVTGGTVTAYAPLNVTNITKYENYTCGARPWDGSQFSSLQVNSTNVDIVNTPPNQSAPILNSSIGQNLTNENLTIWNQSTFDADAGDNVTNVYRWYKNDEPLAVIYLPFDAENVSTKYNQTLDFSGHGFNGSVINATWNYSAGLNKSGEPFSNGAYEFNGMNTSIEFPYNETFNLNKTGTLEAWVRLAKTNQSQEDLPSSNGVGNIVGSAINGTRSGLSYFLNFMNNMYPHGIISNGTSWVEITAPYNLTNGTWHHLVYTWNETNMSLYVNGTEVNRTANNMSAQVILGPLEVGRCCNQVLTDPSYPRRSSFNGTIDEVRVYNFSVSADYVNWSYNNGRPKYNTWYDKNTKKNENYTGAVCPIDGNATGVCLNSSSLYILNFVPNQTTPILNTTNTTGQGLNRSTENLTAYNQSTFDLDPEDIVINIYDWYRDNSSFAVAILPFDISANSSTFSDDLSNKGNNANVTNVIWNLTGGVSGGAYEFNGTSAQQINMSNSSSLNNNAETWEMWFKTNDIDTRQGLFHKGLDTGDTLQIEISRTAGSNKKVSYWDDTDNGNQGHFIGTTQLQNGQWYHLAYTCNSTSGKRLYLNGNLETSSSGTKAKWCSDRLAYDFNIGNELITTNPWNAPFNGTIDEVRVYNLSLTIEQIRANYNDGSPDYSKIVSQETRKGEVWHVEVTPNDGEAYGNSSNSTALEILNQIPSVSNVSITPSSARKEAILYGYGDYGDPDDDQERNSTLKWYIDDVLVYYHNSSQLLLCHFNDLNNTCEKNAVSPSTRPADNISSAVFGNATNINSGDVLEYNAGDNFVIAQGTIEMWINKSNWTSNAYNGFLTANPSGHDLFLFYKDNVGVLTFWVRDSNQNDHYSYYNISTLTSNEFHQFAVAWKFDNGTNSEAYLYVDGVQVNNTFDNRDSFTLTGSLSTIVVGSYASSYYLNGSVDELRITDYILNGSEIKRNYDMNREFHDNEYQFYNTSYTTGTNVTFEYCPDDAVNVLGGDCVNASIIIEAEPLPPPVGGKPPVTCENECNPENYPVCVSDNTKRDCVLVQESEDCSKYVLQDTNCGSLECNNGICSNCGNNIINSGEECDSRNLNGETCRSKGYLRGGLSCSNCNFDFSGCFYNLCNNNILDPGEEGIDCGGSCRECTEEERLDMGRVFCVETMGMTKEEIAELGPLFNLIPCNLTAVNETPKIEIEYRCGGVDLTIEDSVRFRTSFVTDKPGFLLSLISTEKFKEEDYCPWCYDNILNYDETGVDCGGSCGPCLEVPRAVIPKNYLGLIVFLLLVILTSAIISYHSYDDKKRRLISLVVILVDSVILSVILLLDILGYSINIKSVIILSSVVLLFGAGYKLVYKYSLIISKKLDLSVIERAVKQARRETKIDKLLANYVKSNFGYKDTNLEFIANKFREVIKKK